MAEVIGNVVGHAANGVIEVLDVDGVVRKVDVNDALERIDMDALMDRIDMNKVIDSIDLDRQLDRVDIDRVVKRVNINEVVLRSNIPSILAHSTGGIVTEALDSLRKQVILFDLYLMNAAGWLHHFHVDNVLPPKPGDKSTQAQREKPNGRSRTAVAIQGCYTGIVSKGLAILIDVLFVTFSFAFLLIITELSMKILTKENDTPSLDRHDLLPMIAYSIYWFLYFMLTVLLTGRTIGMAIVGIKVVASNKADDDSLSFTRAFVRTLLLPLSSTFFVFLGIIGFFRRDGRMLHDIVAQTGIIYHWDAGMANFREAVTEPSKSRSSNVTLVSSTDPLLANETRDESEALLYNTFTDISGDEPSVFQGDRDA